MEITFTSVSSADLGGEKARHRATLAVPQDAYWESGIIGAATHRRIELEGRVAGFCALTESDYLVQCYLDDEWAPATPVVLDATVAMLGARGALAATNEPAFLSVCLDRQREVAVHTLLYFDHHHVPSTGLNRLRAVSVDDLPMLIAMQAADPGADLETIESNFGGIEGYLRGVIEDGSILALEQSGEIVGTGDFRLRENWPGTADLGVVVAPHRQGQGLGTEILCLLKERAAAMRATPMASTTVENVASQRMIEKSGMLASHRVLRIEF